MAKMSGNQQDQIMPGNRPVAKTNTAYEIIKEKILTNTLTPGTQLTERQLSGFVSVSRTPIREALKRLADEELVVIIPGKCAYVSQISYENITEIYDIREVLEGLAARLFVENINEQRLNELSGIFERFTEAAERGCYDIAAKMDIDFHSFIIDNAKSGKLKRSILTVFSQSKRITLLTQYNSERLIFTREQHRLILEAIEAKDAALAERRMREHINNSKNYHLQNLNHYKF